VPGESLGLRADDLRHLLPRLRAGLPYAALVRFQRTSQLPLERITRVARIPARTLARRKAGNKLTGPESERLLRLALVFEKAVGLFDGDAAAARQWLDTPAKALGGPTPLEAAETEVGARAVEDLIGRLEHGVFS
jgi:putative toxin-antitoxin system antitoxin component (TIGR02293 family)